ncbi:MAG: TetR family transcriptional regulator [Streptosporangiaceae bacterium]
MESDLPAGNVTKPPRRRNPEASRAAILAAARAAFAEQGYARATMREIARRAGVTHGLVTLHFTSKEQLFLAAVPGHRELPDVVAGDPVLLPERVATAYVDRMEKGADSDPLVALLRSAASNVDAATRLYAAMQENSIALYEGILPSEDLAARVELLGAQLIGVTFSRYIARTGRLARMSPDELREHLIPVLRAILLD